MNKIILLFLLSIIWSSCLKENKIVLKQNFENSQDGWNTDNVVTGNGRSGNHFTHTDSLHQISACFSKKLSDISNHKINRIDVVTWIKESTSYAGASFIVSLENHGDTLFWKQMQVDDAFPVLNEWTRMYASYDLPDSIGFNEVLKVYLWNKDKFTIDADDFEIKFYY